MVDPATISEAVSPAGPSIPPARADRDRLHEVVRQYVAQHKPLRPLSLDVLRKHTAAVLELSQLSPNFSEYAAVLVNNEVWRPALGAVPFDRRLLLLPQCLRDAKNCPAHVDHLGLNCQMCGRCSIGEFRQMAEYLGYMVLVAEGSALVMSLIASGRIEAVVGVSCLSVLQKVFPYMEAAAVPGIAIPLLGEGCMGTQVDRDRVADAIHLLGDDKGLRMNLESLQNEVASWFTPASLEAVLGPQGGQTQRLAADWLALSGKRWRPFLAACVFQSIQSDSTAPVPEDFRKIAVAVECFHKASLIHDDIEDKDEFRYGQKTLHAQHGVPIALNVGDLLLGQGYRMIAACDATSQAKADMLAAASRGHCELCAGQGDELSWMASPAPLGVQEVIEIFRLKTSPAFDVALGLGAIYANADPEIIRILGRYSTALGIAYQIHDDIQDFGPADSASAGPGPLGDIEAMRPSILLAIAYERSAGEDRDLLQALWRRSPQACQLATADRIEHIFDKLEVRRKAHDLLESYKKQAIAELAPLEPLEAFKLKVLLHRVMARIFDVAPAMTCCTNHRPAPASAPHAG